MTTTIDPLDRAEQLAQQLQTNAQQYEIDAQSRLSELLLTYTDLIQHHIGTGFINASAMQIVTDSTESTTIRLGILTRIVNAINIYEHSRSSAPIDAKQLIDMPATLLSPDDIERIKTVRWIIAAKQNDGYTYTEACAQACISDSTFRKWRKLYSDYL